MEMVVTERPLNRGPVLHFDALRLSALRKGDWMEETLATESEKKMIHKKNEPDLPGHVIDASALMASHG